MCKKGLKFPFRSTITHEVRPPGQQYRWVNTSSRFRFKQGRAGTYLPGEARKRFIARNGGFVYQSMGATGAVAKRMVVGMVGQNAPHSQRHQLRVHQWWEGARSKATTTTSVGARAPRTAAMTPMTLQQQHHLRVDANNSNDVFLLLCGCVLSIFFPDVFSNIQSGKIVLNTRGCCVCPR